MKRIATLLLAATALLAQTAPRTQTLAIEVTDSKGRYVVGLQQKDFRILEDGIAQKISTFASGENERENSYIVTYTPAPNPNVGFRKIEIRIVSDTDKRFRVRSIAGYRPE